MKAILVRLALIGALAALGAGVCVTAAAAAFGAEAPAVRVRFADLDLTSAEGRLALYRRLDTAAHVVCFTRETEAPEDPLPWRACVDAALGRAVARIGDRQLSDLYLEKRHAGHAARPVRGEAAPVIPAQPGAA
jgi:UrcA family protein